MPATRRALEKKYIIKKTKIMTKTIKKTKIKAHLSHLSAYQQPGEHERKRINNVKDKDNDNEKEN